MQAPYLDEQIPFRKKRCILLFALEWRFEWRMMIGEKFQNQGGDRLARKVTHCPECLLLSKSCNRTFFSFSGSKVYF
jgi:hypothetical protein